MKYYPSALDWQTLIISQDASHLKSSHTSWLETFPSRIQDISAWARRLRQDRILSFNFSTTGVIYPGVVKFLHTLPFGLFLFTDQPVAFFHALTAKPGISALSFAVLPVTHGSHRFFFSQLFFRRFKLFNVMGYRSKSFSPFQPTTCGLIGD